LISGSDSSPTYAAKVETEKINLQRTVSAESYAHDVEQRVGGKNEMTEKKDICVRILLLKAFAQ